MTENSKGTVLLIEDSEPFREIFRDAISADGYSVLEADNGRLGLQLARDAQPDVVLLDLVLPKLHGYQVLEGLRRDEVTRDLPVIVLSVMGESKNMEKALDLGADAYSVKGSVSPQDILHKINAIVEEPCALEEVSQHASYAHEYLHTPPVLHLKLWDALRLGHSKVLSTIFRRS